MRSTLILASLAASTTAQFNLEAVAHARRDLHAMQARATGSDILACASAALDITQSMPTPPPDLLSDIIEHPQTDPCHISLPASLSGEYSSYTKEVKSWINDNKGKLSSLAKSCSIASSYTAVAPVCTSDAGSGGSGGGSSGSGNGGGSDSGGSGSGNGGSASKAAAPRETGMAAMALAAAGIAVLAL
ncbi:hypothetical protein PT974_09815 [Cladobotryum mycophilum]|uniref:Infection structure specific protein n=1 Tax=Cladobotryum mycophilum TaxID=491253 RepID=A0ABR0SI80_9HYPO